MKKGPDGRNKKDASMKKNAFLLASMISWAVVSVANAQNTPEVRMFEPFAPGYLYHVSCRVNITGTLKLAEAKEKQLALTGASAIEFDERVLVEKDHKVDKTIRVYRK